MELPRIPPPLVGASSTSSPQRRTRLQRSERVPGATSNDSPTYSSWETLVRDSFGQITWPIRLTSWELVNDPAEIVPTRHKSPDESYHPIKLLDEGYQ
ncbi:uncharacterized protein DMENIID0001_024040 [Sergentomyia squamirostris]